MAKLHNEWKVLPHGPLTQVAPGLLTVVGQIPMPLGSFPRRMTVAALTGKRIAIFSPIPLPEPDMERIEALGAPAFLIVPNRAHRLDIRPFHSRYPKARVITARAPKAKVEEAVEVDATSADLGKSADLITVAGMGEQELAMLVRHEDGASLIVNDVIGNVRHPKGLGARVMARLTGFGPKPRVPRIEKHFFMTDRKALAGQFRNWAAIDGLQRIIPSHGDIIANPKATLLRIAEDLDT